MMPILLLIGIVALLLCEGWTLAGLAGVVRGDRWLRLAVSLPLAALANTVVFFLCTLAHVPLRAVPLLIGHVVILAGAWIAGRRVVALSVPPRLGTGESRILLSFCAVMLAIVFAYGSAHSLLLPTFQYDSATNWIMRSKQSFLEGRLIFDNAPPHRAILKPHYPFLLHGLQIIGHQGQAAWRDGIAAALPFLTSLCSLAAVGLIVARLRGRLRGLLVVTCVVGVPLFALHLGEGYADHLLAEFGMLALACVAAWREEKQRSWLLLSSVFSAAAIWAKAEGLFFVAIPWALTVLWMGRREAIIGLVPMCVLGLPWTIFALVTGMGLTPHGGNDVGIMFQTAGVTAAIDVLFVSGSFGVLWYALIGAIPFVDRSNRSLLLCGGLSLCIVLTIYLFTPSVAYLLNGQSFDRQLLTPAALLMLGLWLSGQRRGV